MSETGSAGRPARHSRSFGGLIGAMVVTVVGVLLVVGLRSLTSDESVFDREPVDYLSLVRDLQAAEIDVIYPATLPPGWGATEVDVRPGAEPAERRPFSLSVLTDDEDYVGLRVEDAPVADLLEALVDEDYQERAPLVFDGAENDGLLATRWEGYGDDGGDTAYVAEVDGQQVLVYGSASPEQLSDYVTRLTDAPVKGEDSSDQDRQPSG